MKVKKLVKKLYNAIFDHDKKAEVEIYKKLIKKSLKHKKTYLVR